MKRASVMRVLWFFLLGAFLVGPDALAQDAQLVVTTATGLNLRACPDPESCAVLMTLAPGETLIVEGSRDGWLRVEIASGTSIGWVSGRYVRIEEIPAPDHEIIVSPTSRLNLRSCPGISSCPALTVLEVGEALRVLSIGGDWLEVLQPSSGDQGWIHVGYARLDAYSPPGAPSFPTLNPGFWKPILPFVAPTLLVLWLAWFAFKGLEHPDLVKRIVGRHVGIGTATLGAGSLLLLNQFGPWINNAFADLVDLEPLSWTWRINTLVPKQLTFASFALIFLLLVCILIASLPRAGSIRRCVLQGTVAGVVAVPAVVLSIAVTYLIVRLFILIWTFVVWIVTGIFSIVTWIAEILAPVFRWIATPIVWLWDAFLRDLLLFLAKPFVWLWGELVWPLLELVGKLIHPALLWLWTMILLPVGSFLKDYLVKPLFLMIVGLVVGCIAVAPVVAVGAVAWESVKRACRCAEGASEAFGVGVAAGLALFELATFGVFETWWGVGARPPLTLVLLAALALVALVRLVGRRIVAEMGAEAPRLGPTAIQFVKTSSLQVLIPVVMIPIGFALVLLGGGDD